MELLTVATSIVRDWQSQLLLFAAALASVGLPNALGIKIARTPVVTGANSGCIFTHLASNATFTFSDKLKTTIADIPHAGILCHPSAWLKIMSHLHTPAAGSGLIWIHTSKYGKCCQLNNCLQVKYFCAIVRPCPR